MNLKEISICIPTLHNEVELQPFLDKITDDLEIHNIPAKILVSRLKPLTEARMDLIQKVKTKYLIFLDDDIKYQQGLVSLLYERLMLYCYSPDPVDPKTAVLQGSTEPYGLGARWDDALKNPLKYPKRIEWGSRFMTSNAIIITKYVKDWKPSPDVTGCEDWDLTNHILSKGLSIYVIPAHTPHHSSFHKIRSHSFWFAKGYRNLFGTKGSLVYIVKLLLGIGQAILKLPLNWRISVFTLYQNSYIIKSSLQVILTGS